MDGPLWLCCLVNVLTLRGCVPRIWCKALLAAGSDRVSLGCTRAAGIALRNARPPSVHAERFSVYGDTDILVAVAVLIFAQWSLPF